jgi:hypothetical protein
LNYLTVAIQRAYTAHDAGQIVDQTAPFARLTAQAAYPEVKTTSRFKQ